jgi:hypothetical protein
VNKDDLKINIRFHNRRVSAERCNNVVKYSKKKKIAFPCWKRWWSCRTFNVVKFYVVKIKLLRKFDKFPLMIQMFANV